MQVSFSGGFIFFFIYCLTRTLAVFYSHQVVCFLMKLLLFSFTSMTGVILMYTLLVLS